VLLLHAIVIGFLRAATFLLFTAAENIELEQANKTSSCNQLCKGRHMQTRRTASQEKPVPLELEPFSFPEAFGAREDGPCSTMSGNGDLGVCTSSFR
jgi:hypothetical protein